jgi:hypothetical protein
VLLVLFALPATTGAAGARSAAPVVRVSHTPGQSSEVVQAVDGRYVYEAWIARKRGIGFARSVNGGRTFGPSQVVPNSGTTTSFHGWDPAVAVAPEGALYVAFMLDAMVKTPNGPMREMTPVVAVSHDHGKSFSRVTSLPVPTPTKPPGNWGDREFVAVARDGTVYVTWDYGPRADQVKVICLKSGSCVYGAGDFNAVIQKSTDGGATWTMPTAISPGFPLGGAYSAPLVVQRNGTLDVLYWQHPTDPKTLRVAPGHQLFTRSTDGGKTWSKPVAVGRKAGAISIYEWWIDGALALDPAGNLYASWDTQRGGRDTAWLSWSRSGGKRWSAPLRVAGSRSEHLIEVAAAGTRDLYVGWQTPVRSKGYATFLRRLAVGKGWTGPARRISRGYGDPRVWPGDTFGLSTHGGAAVVSWGSALGRSRSSQIYATVARLPAP